MKVALVHERLNVMAGAEKHMLALSDVYPEAPIYTALYTPETMPEIFQKKDVRVSFAQKVPGAAKHHQKFLPIFMFAFEQFDLSDYDVVVSINHACAKSVITRPKTLHVCICCSPMRYAWDMYHDYLSGSGRMMKNAAAVLMSYARTWDYRTSVPVDRFVAISRHVASRIRKYYRRDSTVIYPPVETERFSIADKPQDYYLVVSRLAPYKKVDLAVEAFNRLQLPLVVVGEGEQDRHLRSMARSNIQFLGYQTDEQIAELYSKCQAFIFPGEEDFGITPVEAQAAGRPVVAFNRGGATETVVHGKTGILFDDQTSESLEQAVRDLADTRLDPLQIREHALNFDTAVFMRGIREFVEQAYREHVAANV